MPIERKLVFQIFLLHIFLKIINAYKFFMTNNVLVLCLTNQIGDVTLRGGACGTVAAY